MKSLSINIQRIKLCVWYFQNIKGIKSGCDRRREKILLFICIFGGTLFTLYNFLIYFESGCG
ncbi:hypothetical protein Hanom_Chr05g00406711 [Helianthus anomalus]